MYVFWTQENNISANWTFFPLKFAADKVWINELTLIHNNIRSVCNSHVQELTDIENYRSV